MASSKERGAGEGLVQGGGAELGVPEGVVHPLVMKSLF
jgi:hypothetical protein